MWELIENLGNQEGIEIDDFLSLCFDYRKRGRLKAQTESRQEVGLFLERGQVLQEDDVLKSRCGHHVRVIAKSEPVILAKTEDWHTFSRCCYHLGNRHVPLQIGERWLSFQPDYVLEEMVQLLGMHTESADKAFEPEKGAYSGSHSHGAHSHGAHSHGTDSHHSHDDHTEDEHSHSHTHSHVQTDHHS